MQLDVILLVIFAPAVVCLALSALVQQHVRLGGRNGQVHLRHSRYSILLTVVWAHTRGSVFWAIILHWTINVTANVVGAVFPDIRPPVNEARWLLAGSLAAVTIAVVALIGPRRLRSKVAETRAMLGAESIDADRNR